MQHLNRSNEEMRHCMMITQVTLLVGKINADDGKKKDGESC